MKKKIIFSCFCFWYAAISAQVSSSTCIEASTAIPLSVGQFTVGLINGDPSADICIPNAFPATNGLWFVYIPDADYNVTISSDLPINGTKDTRFHVFKGSCQTLSCVAGSDDVSGSNYKSTASFNVTANEMYYIVWDNKWSNSENFTFELSENPPLASPKRGFTTVNFPTTGSKLGVADMNGDHLDDLINIPKDGAVYNLNIYHQQADGSFVETKYLPQAQRGATWSLAVGDFDGNGHNDLIWGDTNGINIIKANATGTDYSVYRDDSDVFTQRTNFVDINNDGHLDIFVSNDTQPSVYYMSDGAGGLTFYQSAPGEIGGHVNGGSYGSVWVDYDNDRDIDLFIAKCGFNNRDINEMYRNDGGGNYTEVAPILGLDDNIQTWSAAWADFNNDGYMDAFIGSSAPESHKMMLNVPNPNTGDVDNPRVFIDITSSTGLDAFTGRSLEHIPADFDNDGYVDILSGNKILYNNGDMTFTESTFTLASGGIGDLNNDGFLDIFSGTLYRNITNDNNWIKIVTTGDETGGYSNINGIGARVEINTDSGTQIRDVRSGEGFRFMHTLNTHYGIGQDPKINYVRVYWPSGVVDNIVNPTINTTLIINENTTLGLPSTFAKDLKLYPNPVKSILNINTSEDLSDALYTIFDTNGKIVLNSKLKTNNIDVSQLSSGNYILRLISKGATISQKFIKK